MAKFKVVTQKPEGVTFDLAGGSYELEMEALGQVGAEIEEVPRSRRRSSGMRRETRTPSSRADARLPRISSTASRTAR